MAQVNFVKLAAQGRSFDATRPWSEEELAALIEIESCGVDRKVAADYVRNGIMSKAQYERAQAVGFAPKGLDDLRTDAIRAHQETVREQLAEVLVAEPEASEEVREPEKVAEPEVVSEPEAVVGAAEEVAEPEEVREPEKVAEPEVADFVPQAKSKKK